MREIEPMALLSQLARLGTSRPVEIRSSIDEIVAEFELSDFGTAPARFDEAETASLTARHLAGLPVGDVMDDLQAIGVPKAVAADFWDAVRDNVSTRADLRKWWDVCERNVEPLIDSDDAEFVEEAMALLPPETWDGETWQTWTREVRERTGRKGRSLFLPLRKALTGASQGPEMAKLMPLLRKPSG